LKMVFPENSRKGRVAKQEAAFYTRAARKKRKEERRGKQMYAAWPFGCKKKEKERKKKEA